MRAADVAQSIVLGGVLIDGPGTASLTSSVLILLVAAAIAVIARRRHAVPEGAR